MILGSWITKIKLLILCYSLDMQEVMQKRLAIVVMMVMTALKISLAVGFLLKNDILQISFLISFITIITLFLLKGEGRGSPCRRGMVSLKGGSSTFFENSPVPS